MPCYNAAGTVARAIASIQAQSLDDWELIVVDDGSTDDSAKIVAEMSASDSRIQLVRCEHAGVATASNHGFSYATAPFVARMDADDASRPHRLEKQLNALVNNPELGAITCLAHFAGDPKQSAGYAHHVQWTNQQVTTDEMMVNRFIDLPFPHPTLMYRSELVKKYGGYRQGNFPEDYEMMLR